VPDHFDLGHQRAEPLVVVPEDAVPRPLAGVGQLAQGERPRLSGGRQALGVRSPEQIGGLGPLAGLVDLCGRPPQVADLPGGEEEPGLDEPETELVEQVPLPPEHGSQLIHGAAPSPSGSIGRRSRGVSMGGPKFTEGTGRQSWAFLRAL
jgi:hypothetical protein